jgi:hypothetical protein
MKNYKRFLSILLVPLLLNGCKDFEELEKDPNRPTTVPPNLVFRGVLSDMFSQYNRPWNEVQRWNQFNAVNYNYYGNNEYNWAGAGLNYTTLKNVVRMEQEAKRIGTPELNPYTALGKFFRAYFLVNMTMRVGDLPLAEALQGLRETTPAYDPQKDIFVQALTWLEEANDELAQLAAGGDNSLSGDIYFNNDLGQWRKAVNTYALRVLIHLSKKENDPDLKVKGRFAAVLGNPDKYPVMTAMGDNLQFTYNSTTDKYPINPDNFGFDATRYNMAATYLNTLAALKDPRTYYVAEPAGAKLKAGLAPTDFAAFIGAPSGEDLADMSSRAGKDNGSLYVVGEYSFFGRYRYYRTYTAEPTILIGYPELNFNIAEAINRGWVSGQAEDYYRKGIDASMEFYGIRNGENSVHFLKKDGNVTRESDYNTYTISFDPDAYYRQPAVAYAGNNQAGLGQILTQKYLAFFQNSGFEAYFNQRRTGVPAFSAGPGTGNSGRIPLRFQYPNAERTTNGEHLNEALQRQFGTTTDDINMTMWLLK